jgi:hypothetical protein
MGSLRKHTLGAVLLAAMVPFAAGADDLVPAPPDQLRFFATCAGRLSALMEHQWMFDGPGSEVTAKQKQATNALLKAIMPPGQAQKVLGWQIEAKVAYRALLMNAVFVSDPRSGAFAVRRAEDLLRPCTALLLG